MRLTKVFLIATSALFLAALASADDLELRTNGAGSVLLKATLSPVVAAGARGWATYEASKSGEFAFSAQLFVPTTDFKEFGIDASKGFNDVIVELAITKKLTLYLAYSHMDASGVTFIGTENGFTKDPAVRGDVLEALVNGNFAAGGKF